MSLSSLLAADTATLQRSTQTDDTSGGLSKAWANVTRNVPVRIEDATAETVRLYATDTVVVTHTVMTQNADAEKGDRWLDSDGKYLLIQGRRKRRAVGNMDAFYCYDCKEVRP